MAANLKIAIVVSQDKGLSKETSDLADQHWSWMSALKGIVNGNIELLCDSFQKGHLL